MFLLVPVIIIMRFGENNVLCTKYTDIYMNFGGYRGYIYIPPNIFFYHSKNEKVQEHDLYLNQILHHFDLKGFFLR